MASGTIAPGAFSGWAAGGFSGFLRFIVGLLVVVVLSAVGRTTKESPNGANFFVAGFVCYPFSPPALGFRDELRMQRHENRGQT
jgi:hypothetical protein